MRCFSHVVPDQYCLDNVPNLVSLGGRQRLSERSSLSSITSQSSRHSSDIETFMELHNVVADMERAKLSTTTDDTRPILDNQMPNNTSNLSSAFQPLINTRQDRQQVSCYGFDEQTQNLMKNVNSIAESLTCSAAKRALTFSSDLSLDKDDSIRYNFEKGEYCDMLSPAGSIGSGDMADKTPDIHRNLFKPIDTANRVPQEPCSMYKPMATQINHDTFPKQKPQQISILTHPRSSVQNKIVSQPARSECSISDPVSTISTDHDNTSMINSPTTATVASKHQLFPHQRIVTKQIRYPAPVVPMPDNFSVPPQPKYGLPMASPAHSSPHVPLMIDTNLPDMLSKPPVFMGKDGKLLQQMQVAPGHPHLIKYGTKVPMVLPPGAVLPQPLIPPEGYDLVAIDAFGRMMPVQYTDVMYDMPTSYMYPYQPFMPNFKTIRCVSLPIFICT